MRNCDCDYGRQSCVSKKANKQETKKSKKIEQNKQALVCKQQGEKAKKQEGLKEHSSFKDP